MDKEAAARAGINDLVLTGGKRMFDHFPETPPGLVEFVKKPTGCDCREQARHGKARSVHMHDRPADVCVDR